jgi:hypothetical protein
MNENQSEFLQLVSKVKHLFRTIKNAWDDGETDRHTGERRYSMRKTKERERLLEPNKGSRTKVERYDFSFNQNLVIGRPSPINMCLQPCVTMRPQRLICNVPAPGFVIFTTVQVANVAITVGGATDAYSYSAVAVGSHLDCPTITPANRVLFSGDYSGMCPSGRPMNLGKKMQEEFLRLQNSQRQTVHLPKSSKTKTRKARKPDFTIDFSIFDNIVPEGPYPYGSNFLFVATFQGPASIVC